MNDQVLIKITGEVDNPVELTFDDLGAIDPATQLTNVDSITGKYPGDAVKLAGLMNLVKVKSSATHIGLHGSADDFHASIPLSAVLEKAFLIYRLEGKPLEVKNGGPSRFFVPDHAECQMDEIDECSNVKFLDHIELTVGKGFDNRPTDDESHRRLHEGQE